MRTILLILAILGSTLSCNTHIDKKINSPNIITDTLSIPKDSSTLYFPKRITSDGKEAKWYGNAWYSEVLFALHEPVLSSYTGNQEIFRFTWLRTFHNPVAIRIQNQGGNITLTVKVSNGQGGYDPGQIIVEKNIPLSINDWNGFINNVGKIGFWGLPTDDTDDRGMDGSEWILEGVTKNKYHFTIRWMAGRNEYGDCCKYLLNLSHLNIEQDLLY